ncbi:MAG TPA: nickel pincer cofactor biosynthesis protein LarC [Acidimicrobiaceae bacterium]|nr:nickel pincer cofactor biosynthesis protein LarC [Acidimicrobiaceae bacterium]
MTETAPRTTAWFHCFAGIAGDMALASLLDAGADLAEVRGILERLPLSGWRLEVESVLRAGLGATRAVVVVSDDVVVRTYMHIVALVEEARLPPRVASRSLATFAALAGVEGELHRRPPERVHFHEVGGHDTLVDVVGTAAALEVLDVDEVLSSPVATGTGTIRSAHGLLPNPSPAVVRLLRGAPTYGRDVAVELTTPTGAALLSALASGFGPLPPMRVDSTGFGAGTRDLEGLPNCTQVVVGEALPEEVQPGHPLVVLETNVDDATGETLAHALEVLLSAGALDAWITPVLMKKGRPGHTVSALVDVALVESVRHALRSETGSLGVRSWPVERWAARREFDTVIVDGMPVRVKIGPGRVKAEHADAARVAARSGRPLREVISDAEGQWRLLKGRQPDPEDRFPPRPDGPEPA